MLKLYVLRSIYNTCLDVDDLRTVHANCYRTYFEIGMVHIEFGEQLPSVVVLINVLLRLRASVVCKTFANDIGNTPLATVSPGTTAKEPSRAKLGARSRLSQRMRLPAGYVRSLLLSIAAAFVRMITEQLDRSVFC